jgi:heptosyltransferase-3
VLHAATRWRSKSWPPERWRETLRRLLAFTPRVVVSCGPGGDEIREARALAEGFGDRVLPTLGAASWGQLAWLLARARYFVGVDTAAMHLAAAMGCPAAVLFGESLPGQYAPWQSPHVLIGPAARREEEVEAATFRPSGRMMAIGVEEVEEACRRAASFRTGESGRPGRV